MIIFSAIPNFITLSQLKARQCAIIKVMKKAILQTLCYHDLFDYPLTLAEIHRFLIGKKASLKKVRSTICHLPFAICRNGSYFLKGREEIVATRRRREKYSRKKLPIAQRAAGWLQFIPTVKMIALTGAVAVENAKKNDDIDFLIITAKKRLWLTRLAAVLLIELLAKRPQLKEKKLKDTICLNIFLAEDCLRMPEGKQNLFVAHEIAQMKILWQKGNLYQKFLKQNQWLKKFLPNWKK